MSEFEQALQRVVRDAKESAKSPAAQDIQRRGRRRAATRRAAAVAGVTVAVVAIATTGLALRGRSQSTDVVDPSPTVSPSQAAPTPTATPTTEPSLPAVQLNAAPLGKAPQSPGPAVDLVARDGTSLLVPGSANAGPVRLEVGAGGTCGLAESPDHAWAAYGATGGHLHVVRLQSREVWDLGVGCAPSWGRGGLAYLVSSTPDDLGRYRSELLVRPTALAEASIWAEGELASLDWVGDQLVYQSHTHPQPAVTSSEVLIASAPGTARSVLPVSNLASFVASSPDGTRFLIHVDQEDGVYVKPHLRLYDTATLEVLADVHGQGFESLADGVWIGDDVLAGESYSDGGSVHLPPVLHHLHVAGSTITEVARRDLSPSSGAQLFRAILRVQALGSSVVVTRGNDSDGLLISTCRVTTLDCSQPRRLETSR